MLLDLFLSFEFLSVLPEILELIFLSFALSIGIILSFLSHIELMLETVFHFFSCFPLTFDGGILFLELVDLSPQFLASRLSIIVKDLCFGDLSCKLVEDLLILH